MSILNPKDHPAGTRVLCSCMVGFRRSLAEITILEWSPLGSRFLQRYRTGVESWEDTMLDVVEVLSKPSEPEATPTT